MNNTMQTTNTHWSNTKKWFFLTCIGFFGFTTFTTLTEWLLVWHSNPYIFDDWLNKKLATPIGWLDKHFYHFGFNKAKSELWPDDNYFGAIYYTATPIFFALLALVAVWLWGKKINFQKLSFWFRLYMRYILASILLGYGLIKIIPVQMAPPFLYDLFMPLGDHNEYGLFWTMIGASKPYEIFAGICEVSAALMLLSRRTAVFGLLTSLTVMTNVVAYNYFYNVSVKFYSAFILLIILWLLAPYIKVLFAFFIKRKAVAIDDRTYRFAPNYWNIVLKTSLVLLSAICIYVKTTSALKWYGSNKKNLASQKLYTVQEQFTSDSTFHATPDSLQWKRFIISSDGWNRHFAVCQLKDDKMAFYDYKIDSAGKKITLQNIDTKVGDSAVFTGFAPGNVNSTISGTWRKRAMILNLQYIRPDSLKFELTKPQFNFVQRDEY